MEIIIIASKIGVSAVISLDENRGLINETVRLGQMIVTERFGFHLVLFDFQLV